MRIIKESQEDDHKTFYVGDVEVRYDENENRWIDSDGNKYMGYLTPSDIKMYFRDDDY